MLLVSDAEDIVAYRGRCGTGSVSIAAVFVLVALLWRYFVLAPSSVIACMSAELVGAVSTGNLKIRAGS